MNPRAACKIGRTVLIEAVRRREIYVIVLASCLLIGAVLSLDFFQLQGLTKFYREISLKVMSAATALAVIVLAARQLPREFETRTIYPLLAKPVSRTTFLFGKLLGVLLAAAFCLALFMVVFIGGTLYLRGAIPWALFGQYVCLQMVMMLVLATLGFCLSMVLNLDAAITLGVILYGMAATFTSALTFLYEYVGPLQRKVLIFLNYAIPQLALFDLSEKATHSDAWGAVEAPVIAAVTAYGFVFAGVYFGLALWLFRRRAL
jgi:ABC-type transport system involved in multi-copper enzyme maturation permease subunit